MQGILGRACGLAGILCLAAATSGAAAASHADDDVKAAFLLRFTGYMTWRVEDEAVQIAVMGSPRIAAKLRHLQDARAPAGRKVSIRNVARLGEARGAHILYVANNRRVAPATLLWLASARGTLVVTDTARGLAAGGAINFLTVDRRVSFEVSLGTARLADVRISSELLSVAARVQDEPAGAP